jgi:hypothetical protein
MRARSSAESLRALRTTAIEPRAMHARPMLPTRRSLPIPATVHIIRSRGDRPDAVPTPHQASRPGESWVLGTTCPPPPDQPPENGANVRCVKHRTERSAVEISHREIVNEQGIGLRPIGPPQRMNLAADAISHAHARSSHGAAGHSRHPRSCPSHSRPRATTSPQAGFCGQGDVARCRRSSAP